MAVSVVVKSCGDSSLTPTSCPREDAELGGGRLGDPGAACRDGLEKSEFSVVGGPVWSGEVFILPEMVLLLPSSVRRGATMGRVEGYNGAVVDVPIE